ncbi:hypothetical protein PybrP1_004834 [[Pythium] brassicae (nom. inval.)]|nr:hypothetical protein PybrP1_004834 [[Pythium] brassicae (nom. inval.)]
MAKDASEVRRQEKIARSFDDIARADTSARFAISNYDVHKKKFPVRTGMAAASLFALGSVLIFVSTRIGLDGEHRGLSFLILGLIAFIPGSYASYQLYGSYKGWKGYDYSQIPSYDD